YDVLIIGSGPSGLAAAAEAAGRGLKTAVLERNEVPAKKIYATGNGRCNFSNVSARWSWETVPWMKDAAGVEAAEEEGRIYPRSFEAAAAAEALVSAAKRAGAEVICGARAAEVSRRDTGKQPGEQKFAQRFVVKCEDGRTFEAEKLVLATGGKAGIQYGCYGDGYKLAESLGHSIVKPIPALDGICCAENISALHGVRVRAKASVIKRRSASGSEGAEETMGSSAGEVQFTKSGISGICVMDVSRFARLEEGAGLWLSLDLFPEKSGEELAEFLIARKTAFGCGLKWLLPEKLTAYLHTRTEELAKTGLSGPAAMAALCKDLRFRITGTRGWKTAQVTCGGVRLSEVDQKTFGSLVCPGLFITGELLDYDGPCGGFNIDWALHTGITAGRSV
ncbi:MAG: aminoacetone oxidase family FAD-binding enzyme, partial [Desulfovibrionaceae bacterium]|nr:aminoacetone oxidase family FAD-binding enzyme [Desulfovibrionaceae bacterium]